MDILGDLPPLDAEAEAPASQVAAEEVLPLEVATPEPVAITPPPPETKPRPRIDPAHPLHKHLPMPPPDRTPWIRRGVVVAVVLVVLAVVRWREPIARGSRHAFDTSSSKLEDLMGIGTRTPSTPASDQNPFSKSLGFEQENKPPANANPAPTATAGNREAAKPAPVQPQSPPLAPRAEKEPGPAKAGEEAAKLWKQTARGDPNAPLKLADMYANGDGVPQSCDQAVVLLKTAALRENSEARNRLASMYADAVCVQRDRLEAYRWVKSALAANPDSQPARLNRDRIWEEMTVAERMQTQKAQ